MNWDDAKPVEGVVEREGHTPFTYQFTAEEVAYLEEHGFERSVVEPAKRWIRPADAALPFMSVEVAAHGLLLTAVPWTGQGRRTTTKTGLGLIPLIVWAKVEGLL